jgi:hypothetical protein
VEKNMQQTKLYAPNIIRVIQPRTMRWAGYVARMGDETEEVLTGFGGDT